MMTVTTKQGDTWDIVSKRVYGSEKYMHVLLNANIDHRKTVIFPAGVILDVPAVDTIAVESEDLPPWKRGGA